MRRSLIYYWRINLAVLLGAALATAVLTGALLVGDSVRGSLRDLALDRLGSIDYAITLNRFVRQELGADFLQNELFRIKFEKPVPAILSICSITNAATKAHATKVNLHGIDGEFADLFPKDSSTAFASLFAQNSNQLFPSLIINETLSKELNAEPGQDVLITLQRQSEIHRETLLGSRASADVVKTARFTITRIIPDRGIGRFGLYSNQSLPLNAYVSLTDLQKAINQTGKINNLFFAKQESAVGDSASRILHAALRKSLQLEDLGVKLRKVDKFILIESSEIILDPTIEKAVNDVSEESAVSTFSILTYLANKMQFDDRLLPYSTITAIGQLPEWASSGLRLIDGSRASTLAEGDILLNEWAAEDLTASAGDTIKISYYAVGLREQLLTKTASFRVAGVVAMTGLGADAALTPEFPGIHDAEDMQSWNPPFPVDLNLIRKKDEAYWDRYRASPKAFVALAAGQRLWSSRFGNLTSIRVGIPDTTNDEVFGEDLESRLLQKISPQQMGFDFLNVKQKALHAASGATDFSMLFVGFSFFLIISAALLVGMLFRLGVEQRAAEVGTLLAVGFPANALNKKLLGEGALLAGIGCAIGLFGAIGYAWLMMRGLRTWWVDAVGSPFLFLYLNASTMTIGYIAAIVVTLFSIWLAVRRLSRIPAPALLHGVTAPDRLSPAKWSRFITAASTIGSLLLLVFAILANATSSAGLFFGIGALVLVAGLSVISLWFRKLRRPVQNKFGGAIILRMAIEYGARNPGRSILSAGLVCCASFIIVAVAANRKDHHADSLVKNSGTGGFALVAQSDIPLHHDMNSKTGLDELGFADEDADSLTGARFFPLRLLPGEDVSCLNLYQPQQPRILGAPDEFIQRGGFSFKETTGLNPHGENNPWLLLEQEIADDVIPAFGDYNSVMWIMHLGLGKDLIVRNEFGKEVKLRFVGLLESSIFQSEVIISEKNFLEHFPGVDGYAYFLIENQTSSADRFSGILENALRDYGFDATSTEEKLASFQAVENTYLSVFQTLGGLGLLLGTIGLGIVLIRNVIERRGELATLRAFGFRRSTLTFMLIVENVCLVLIGITIGTVSALLAVAPHLTSGNAHTPWFSLSLTLLFVVLVGFVVSAASVVAALRIPLLPALKAK